MVAELRDHARIDERVLLGLSFIPEDLLRRVTEFRNVTTESSRSPDVRAFHQAAQNPRTPWAERHWQRERQRFERIQRRPPTDKEWAALRRRRPAMTRTKVRRLFSELGLDHKFPSEAVKFASLWSLVFIPLCWYLKLLLEETRPGADWYASRLVAARGLWEHNEAAVDKIRYLTTTKPATWPLALHAWQRARCRPGMLEELYAVAPPP